MNKPSREALFLAEVARRLIHLSHAGATGGCRETAENLHQLAQGCRALRYKRLYWILEALATRLGKPQPDMTGAQLEELGRLLADARYTCKALKSLQQGSLTDLRVREDLVGSSSKEEDLGLIQNRSLVRVGEVINQEGDIRYRISYLLDTGNGQLYAARSHRQHLKEGHLDAPFANLGSSPMVRRARILPSFTPHRLQIELHEPGSVNEGGLRDFLETQTPDTVGGLLERFRSAREEYLAPRTLPIFFRPVGFDPALPGCLVDRHGNGLKLLREPSTFALCEHLSALLRPPPEETWAVFGKLIFVTETFHFLPWSLLHPDAPEPVILLRRGSLG
jgi:hypothetical protein